MNKWEGVTEFVTVAEHGSFTKAAQQLKVSVAHISRQVSALEGRLDAILFYRTTRRVSLTELGEIYYQRCRPLLEALDEAEDAISDMQETAKGRLRLTAPVAFGELKIVPILNSLLADFPDLDLDLNLTNRQLDLVSEGLDLAIRVGHMESSRLKAKKLSERHLITCASPAYLKTYGEPYSLSELAHHSCLLGTLDYWRYRESGQATNVKVTGRMRCNNGPALVEACLAGFGIVQLPDYYVAEALQDGKLTPLLSRFAPVSEGVWAVYPQNRHLSPKVRLVVDYMAKHLGG